MKVENMLSHRDKPLSNCIDAWADNPENISNENYDWTVPVFIIGMTVLIIATMFALAGRI